MDPLGQPGRPEIPPESPGRSDAPGGTDAPSGTKAPGHLLRLIRDQRVAFLLVGGVNTLVGLVGFVVFGRFIHLWGGDGAVLAAQTVAIPFAFTLHRRFVFRVSGHVVRDFGRFVLVNAIPVGANLTVLPVLTTVAGWRELPAQLLFTAVWVASSFFIHRGFSFRRTTADHQKLAAKQAASRLLP